MDYYGATTTAYFEPTKAMKKGRLGALESGGCSARKHIPATQPTAAKPYSDSEHTR
jgi:hypothetical protein